jgi:hypothetical protein
LPLPLVVFAIVRRPDGTPYPAEYFETHIDNPPLRYRLEDVTSDGVNRRTLRNSPN